MKVLMQKGNSTTKRIKLFVTKKWLYNKTFHKISCFHWWWRWQCWW